MMSQCSLIWTAFQHEQHQLLWGLEVRSWVYGVAMFGAARGHRREVATPSLMANMYGFTSEEEMSDMKDYLLSTWWLPA